MDGGRGWQRRCLWLDVLNHMQTNSVCSAEMDTGKRVSGGKSKNVFFVVKI